MDLKNRKALIGRKFKHDEFVEVEVIGLIPKSQTKVEVRVVYPGVGKHTKSRPNLTEKGNLIGASLHFSKGINPEFGHEDVVRIDSLKNEIVKS